MKFQVGEKVKVRNNLPQIKVNRSPGLIDAMLKYECSETTIKYVVSSVDNHTWYGLENNSWTWAEEWLEFAGVDIEIPEDDFINLFKEE